MAYGVIATERKVLSDVVAALGGFESETGVDRYTSTVNVKATGGDVTVQAVGLPLVASGADYVPYVAQSLSGAKVAVLVGDNRGAGFNTEDIVIGSTAKAATALVRGEAAVKSSGLDWQTGSGNTEKTAFIAALEKQGITIAKEAASA